MKFSTLRSLISQTSLGEKNTALVFQIMSFWILVLVIYLNCSSVRITANNNNHTATYPESPFVLNLAAKIQIRFCKYKTIFHSRQSLDKRHWENITLRHSCGALWKDNLFIIGLFLVNWLKENFLKPWNGVLCLHFDVRLSVSKLGLVYFSTGHFPGDRESRSRFPGNSRESGNRRLKWLLGCVDYMHLQLF